MVYFLLNYLDSHVCVNIELEKELSMIKSQIKIDGLELEIEQGSHVIYRDEIGDIAYSPWCDLDTDSKQILKNAIIKAEKIISLSANAIWNSPTN